LLACLLLDNALQNQLLDGGGGEPLVAGLDEVASADGFAVDGRHDSVACRQRRRAVLLGRLWTLLLGLLPLLLLALLLGLLLLTLLRLLLLLRLLFRFLLRLRLQRAARKGAKRKHDSKHAR
jgi:hypothetical protein